MIPALTRRRFIAVTAVAAGTMGLGRPVSAASLHSWRGVALGAAASIRLAHADGAEARRLIDACVAEITRLERIFSLYDDRSAVVRLNAAGRLELPPLELVELLARAATVSAATDGVFDATVQPLWRRYAEHFASADADPAGPDLADVLTLVDWRGVRVAPDRISFARPGMAVTLNGIAQGYVTDVIAALLRREGMTQVLVDLGELRALGTHPDGHPWRVGLADPADPSGIALQTPLSDMALATSGGYGTRFEASGRFNHLMDPRSGHFAPASRSISVVAADATTADAASTALSLLPLGEAPGVLRRLGASRAFVLGPEGPLTITA